MPASEFIVHRRLCLLCLQEGKPFTPVMSHEDVHAAASAPQPSLRRLAVNDVHPGAPYVHRCTLRPCLYMRRSFVSCAGDAMPRTRGEAACCRSLIVVRLGDAAGDGCGGGCALLRRRDKRFASNDVTTSKYSLITCVAPASACVVVFRALGRECVLRGRLDSGAGSCRRTCSSSSGSSRTATSCLYPSCK